MKDNLCMIKEKGKERWNSLMVEYMLVNLKEVYHMERGSILIRMNLKRVIGLGGNY